jgi:uncharacterized protein YycO
MTRYIIAALVLITALVAIFFEGKKAGKESEVIIQQAETIQTQHETIQTVKKSKVIAKNNASLERDALIDKL